MAIQSIQRALDIIALFSKNAPFHRLSDIAKALDLNVSTAHGIIATLEKNGFLQHDPNNRQYKLGTKIFELGAQVSANLRINIYAKDQAQRLAERTNFNNRVGIWNTDSVLITLFAFPQGIVTTVHTIGPTLLPYCTAIGKALLAFMEEDRCMAYLRGEKLAKHTKNTITTIDGILSDLQETRERGYALNRGELVLSRAGIAAPIWGPGKCLEGALAMIGNSDQIRGKKTAKLADELIETVSVISESLGYAPGE